MLQSRPITNLDNNFTDWEIMHELDLGHVSENEYLTKANIGEVMPGATSHLALTLSWRSLNVPMTVSWLYSSYTFITC